MRGDVRRQPACDHRTFTTAGRKGRGKATPTTTPSKPAVPQRTKGTAMGKRVRPPHDPPGVRRSSHLCAGRPMPRDTTSRDDPVKRAGRPHGLTTSPTRCHGRQPPTHARPRNRGRHAGRLPARKPGRKQGPVAQQAEHGVRNAEAAGSTPARSTKRRKKEAKTAPTRTPDAPTLHKKGEATIEGFLVPPHGLLSAPRQRRRTPIMLRDNARRGNGFVPLTPLGHGVWKGARRVPKRGPRCNPVAGTKPWTKPTRTAYDTSNTIRDRPHPRPAGTTPAVM